MNTKGLKLTVMVGKKRKTFPSVEAAARHLKFIWNFVSAVVQDGMADC